LEISPDPIVLGQNITVAAAGKLGTNITYASAALTIEKKIFGIWTEM
jgi:hypothetical protein